MADRPAWGNASIGHATGPQWGAFAPVTYPLAINRLPANSAGMANAHIGMNYTSVLPDGGRGFALNGCPGFSGALTSLYWEEATGQWSIVDPLPP